MTMNALVKRINRRLRPDDEQLHKPRFDPRNEFGDFYIRDTRRNFIVTTHVDPVELGKELGVLYNLETVIE